MNGFDWLKVPVNESSTPAPPVSFLSDLNLPGSTPTTNSISQQASPIHNSSDSNHSLYNHRSQLQNDVSTYDIPLSLTTQDLTLQELKTYIRWYTNILSRTNTRTIHLQDVFNFLSNFKIPQPLKDEINRLFKNRNINIGEFCALLRLISHGLSTGYINRSLVKEVAPVPKPLSILSKKRQSEEVEEDIVEPPKDSRLDLDSFTTFMLTGERPTPKRRKNKSVKFMDDVVSDIHESSVPEEIDYSLPMNEILKLQNQQRSPQPDEEEVLKDMNDQLNHFQHLNAVDTVSVGGRNTNVHLRGSRSNSVNGSTEELLKPNMTGPAQMSQYYSHLGQDQQDNLLKPNRTGPYDMMRMFSPDTQSQVQAQNEVPKISLSAFTDQMTGTGANTLNNTNNTPPPPPSRRNRSQSSPTLLSDRYSPLSNLRTESEGRVSPRPPPPPPPRRGANLSPALPPKIPNEIPNQQYSYQQPPYQPQQPIPHHNISASTFYPNNEELSDIPAPVQEVGRQDTNEILDDLKALQAEVDKIRDMTGGF